MMSRDSGELVRWLLVIFLSFISGSGTQRDLDHRAPDRTNRTQSRLVPRGELPQGWPRKVCLGSLPRSGEEGKSEKPYGHGGVQCHRMRASVPIWFSLGWRVGWAVETFPGGWSVVPCSSGL